MGKRIGATVVLCLTVAGTLLAYSVGGEVIPAAAAKTQTKAQKLAKALKACKKDKSKSKRKACEKKADKLYGKQPKTEHHATETTTGTGTGTGTTAGTGTTTTTGTTTGTGATTGTGTATGTGTGTGAGTTTGGTETPPQELEKAKSVGKMPGPTELANGKTLFTTQCSGCHGPNGEGVADEGPNLHEVARAQSITGVIEQLIQPINELAYAMPNFDQTLTFSEKQSVADYVAVEITKVAEAAH